MNPKVHVGEAIQLPEIEAVRALFVEYAGTLPVDLGYQGIDYEISGFPRKLCTPGRSLVFGAV